MTDTVSEDVKLDARAVSLACEAYIMRLPYELRGGARHAHPLHEAIASALRAYLAATKPASPLADVLQKVRATFKVEYGGDPDVDGGVQSVSYGSEALRPMIALLDAALASPPTPGRGEGFVLVPVGPLEKALKFYDDAVVWHSYSYHNVNREAEQHEAAAKLANTLRALLAASRPKEDTHAE